MFGIACQSKPPVAGNEKTIVLVLPEALGDDVDPASLRVTLAGSPTAVRVILCLPDAKGHSLAMTLAELGIEMEILLGPEVEAPATTAFVLRAPPGTSAGDQTELALALSDVVLVTPASEQSRLTSEQRALITTAENLRKPMIVPGAALPTIPSYASVTQCLDPDLPGYHARARGFFGRLEQFVIELFAYNWRDSEQGVAESRKRLRKCMKPGWRPTAYFAPDDWLGLAPDRAAIDGSSKIVARFDAMDRSALHGSYIHRDLIWIEHIGAAFAVLLAVLGQLYHTPGYGVAEFITLAVVAGLVMAARRTNLLDRWTACRLGAEQIRIARMSMPLLVLPQALATEENPLGGDSHGSKKTELEFLALAEVKRVVRDHGLPRLKTPFEPGEAAAYLQLIIRDQIAYHHSNHLKLEKAESRLRFAAQAFFVISMAAVLAHFAFEEARWLILFTAAGPAFAAALHGAGTRLGIVHRAALSLEVDRELTQVDNALTELIKRPPSAVIEAWKEVRKRAYEATEIMGSENTSWHGLVRRYRDELP